MSKLQSHATFYHACRLSNNFREATKVVSAKLPSSIPAGHVMIRVAFAGVNASDVNFSAGRYQASIAEAQASLPFDAGFEAVGAVAAVGPQVSGQPGTACSLRSVIFPLLHLPLFALFPQNLLSAGCSSKT